MSHWLAPALALFLASAAAAEDLTLCRDAYKAAQEGEIDRALELYRECVQKGDLSHESLANAERNIGVLLYNKKEAAAAAEAFGRAIAENPPDAWQDYLNRGNAWLELGDSQGALADFEQTLALKPDEPRALYGRGIVYERLGREFDAYAQFARASQLGLTSRGVTERLELYRGLKLDRIEGLRGSGFGKLGSSYAVGASARAPKLGAISAASASCALEELGPIAEYPGSESLRASGRYEFPGGGVSVLIPPLAGLETLDVRIHAADHARGVNDDYLSFSSGAEGPARAAVLRTTLPKRMRTSLEVHRGILDELDDLGAGFPREDFVIRDLDGPWGPIVELLVRNRGAGGACFPTSTFVRAAAPEAPTIGVSRYVHRGDLLLELALIVSLPKNLPRPEQAEYARARMDEFMGAVTIQAPAAP